MPPKKVAVPVACCTLCGTMKALHGMDAATIAPGTLFGLCTLTTKSSQSCGGTFCYLGTLEAIGG